MRRRRFLASLAAVASGAALGRRGVLATAPLGPFLFLDDQWIESARGLERRPEKPTRLERPVLDSATFGTTQPYLSIVRMEKDRLRIWYNRGPAVWTAESSDGEKWMNPRQAWKVDKCYGCGVIDDGERDPDPARRFKMANWQVSKAVEDRPEDDGGMFVGFSPDGLTWSPGGRNPVLETWPEGYGTFTRHGVGDTVDVWFDPLMGRYAAAVKVHALPADGFVPGPKSGKAIRRLVGISTSGDFESWTPPERIFVPDEKDEGLLEFYGMGGMHAAGGQRIGFVRVLRDDLPGEAGGPVDGIGYSVLATSRDGVHWTRMREPFFDRNPTSGTWDRAMSWVGAVVPSGDELVLYYGGYARGHKIEPERERQIGMARMKRDRYVAMTGSGTLVTRPMVFAGNELTVNADATGGPIAVGVLDESSRPVVGHEPQDCEPIRSDALLIPVRWQASGTELVGKMVRLVFHLTRAKLFGFRFSA